MKPLPLHYEFFSTVAIDIYFAAKNKGASVRGALFVIAQAALESGYAKSAIQSGDYNLFGQMAGAGQDSKRKTSHGRVRDFSKIGGYKASMEYYFNHISNHGWTALDLIKKQTFTADDIDKAFNTGIYYPTDKQRHDGKFAYNADIGNDKKNHYGETLYKQMITTKKYMLKTLDYLLEIYSQIMNDVNHVRAERDKAQMSFMSIKAIEMPLNNLVL